MSSLYIDRQNVQLDYDSGAIVFREAGQRIGTVALAGVTRVVLRGSATLPASLLGRIGAAGAGVVILSGRRAQPTLMLSRPHSDARRRIAQVRLALEAAFCLQFARGLVREKIAGHRSLLDELRPAHPAARRPLTSAMQALDAHLASLDAAASLAALRGIEGAAASAWFAALRAVLPASLGFAGRNRRPPRDPFNALLSLSYTLAGAELALALHGSGLDAAIGYYHQPSHARHSLACDLLEPLRPRIDRFCLRLIARQTLSAEHFCTSAANGCLLGKAGRSHYYNAWERSAAPALRRAISAQVQQLLQTIAPAMPALLPEREDEETDI